MGEMTEIACAVALHGVPGMGPVTFRRLVERFGSARGVFQEAGREGLAEVRGVTLEMVEAITRGDLPERAEPTVELMRKRGVRIVCMGDHAYPDRLRDLLNPPPLLYMVGDIGPQDARALGMVGTTKPSRKGRAIAEEFAARLAARGVTVVSGYAHGVDAAAHRGAFKGGGRSILCVPFGIRHFRPRPDFPRVSEIAARGAIVSECPPDQEWSSAAAIARNRIIAALSGAVFVIETRVQGGTMHTVKAAQNLGRPLLALKYDDAPPSARGNAVLVARGATPIRKFNEIGRVMEAIGVADAEA